MTSPIGKSGRDQTTAGGDTAADERIRPDVGRTAPGNGDAASEPIVPDADRIVPDAGRTAPGTGALDDERIVPDGERIVLDEELLVLNDEQITPDDERITDDKRIVPGGERIALASERKVLDKDDVVGEGGSTAEVSAAAGPPPDVTSGSAAARRSASESTGPPGRWPEIQAMFVDDPRASVELAAGLMDDSVETLFAAVKERQLALLSTWRWTGAGTEELRNALRAYRTFWNQVYAFWNQVDTFWNQVDALCGTPGGVQSQPHS